jgi:hypothetical protein
MLLLDIRGDLSLPSQLANPPQISRKLCARPSWQKSMATNWPGKSTGVVLGIVVTHCLFKLDSGK